MNYSPLFQTVFYLLSTISVENKKGQACYT